jgi:CBS-domain-containing membrane protein
MPDNAVATLRIHRSLTVTPHGQHHKSTVTCPRTGHVVDTATCTSCDGLRRMLPTDDKGLGWRILCEPGPDAMALRRTAENAEPCVADVMTTEVVCVSPDVSAQELTSMFITRGMSGAPVVDADGNAIGVVSKTDLIRLDRRRNFSDACTDSFDPTYEIDVPPDAIVRDVMTRSTFALAETMSLRRAAAELVDRGLHRAPVLDARGKVVGIVSALDLLRWFGAQ